MDKNKLKVLKEIFFTIRPTCILCKEARFPNDDWGTCNANTYEHEKHTESPRFLSIHKSGICHKFMLDPSKGNQLGEFIQLLDQGDTP